MTKQRDSGERERIGVRSIGVLVYGNSSGIEPECLAS